MNIDKYLKNATVTDKKNLCTLLNIPDLRLKYEYIYDLVCEQLDKDFRKYNYCDFRNDKCICQRTSKKVAHDSMGCCYTFKNSKLTGFPVDTKLCKYLQNGSCSIQCISCKLFTCSYLKKNKIKFSPNDFFLIKVFFNRKQKSYIKNAFFTGRNEIIDNLLKMNTKLE